MAKVLVVWYSRGGNTEKLARAITDLTGWDGEGLVDTQDRRGIAGYLRSGRDSVLELCTTLVEPQRRPRDYDLVVVGTPVWVGGVSSPVRSYLLDHAVELPEVAFFATFGGRGAERAFRQMGQLAHREPVATLAVTERQLAQGKLEQLVPPFIELLGRRLPDALATRASVAAPAPPPQ